MNALLYFSAIFGISIEVYVILAILGVPTFFVWRWLLKKIVKTDNTRKMATWIATVVTTPFIYVGLIILWIFSISYHPTHDFDQDQWFADKESRYELSEDIIDSNMLIGKTKSEVRQLLGDEGNAEESDYWYYYLGLRPGFANIDPDVLTIEFKQGKVIRVGQHET